MKKKESPVCKEEKKSDIPVIHFRAARFRICNLVERPHSDGLQVLIASRDGELTTRVAGQLARLVQDDL